MAAKKKTVKRIAKKKTVKRAAAKKPVVKEVETKVPFTCTHCGGQFDGGAELSKHMTATPCGEHLAKCFGRHFVAHVEVSPPNEEQAAARCEAIVVRDRNSRTAIEMRRSEGVFDTFGVLTTPPQVTFVPYLDSGLSVVRMPAAAFDKAYVPIPDYPTGRAAKLYAGFVKSLGATREAMAELAKLTTITTNDIEVAAMKLTTNKGKRTITKVVKSSKGDIEMAVERKARNTAAEMFRGLIMEGKFTDDQIFAKVKKAFDLEDKCRSHVGWYRNKLKRTGKNPPPAIRATGSKAAKKTTKKAPAKKKAAKKTTKKAPAKKKVAKKTTKK